MDALKILEEAIQEGIEAGKNLIPNPMLVIQHKNMADDSSPVEKVFYEPEGACGFAWIQIKCNSRENRKFISGLKKAGVIGNDIMKDSYYGGYVYWIRHFGQSIARKEKMAERMAEVLSRYGIKAYVWSRLD